MNSAKKTRVLGAAAAGGTVAGPLGATVAGTSVFLDNFMRQKKKDRCSELLLQGIELHHSNKYDEAKEKYKEALDALKTKLGGKTIRDIEKSSCKRNIIKCMNALVQREPVPLNLEKIDQSLLTPETPPPVAPRPPVDTLGGGRKKKTKRKKSKKRSKRKKYSKKSKRRSKRSKNR